MMRISFSDFWYNLEFKGCYVKIDDERTMRNLADMLGIRSHPEAANYNDYIDFMSNVYGVELGVYYYLSELAARLDNLAEEYNFNSDRAFNTFYVSDINAIIGDDDGEPYVAVTLV